MRFPIPEYERGRLYTGQALFRMIFLFPHSSFILGETYSRKGEGSFLADLGDSEKNLSLLLPYCQRPASPATIGYEGFGSSEMTNPSEPVRKGGCRNRNPVVVVQDGSGQTAAADTAFPSF